MNLIELIETRRTIHDFKAEPVSAELVNEAIRLALLAPNHRHTFPWQFFWPGEETKSKLADKAIEIKLASGDFSPTKAEALKHKFKSTPVLLGIGMKRCEDAFQAREDYASVACGVQNLSLYLWSQGVGTKWTSGEPTYHPDTYQILGADPAQVELVGFLWIGIPARIPGVVVRPGLNSVIVRS